MKYSNEKGFTLPELLVGIVLVSLLAYGFAMAMLQFLVGYQETRDYMSLQQQMLNLVDYIRHGYVVEGVNHNQPLIGLMTAQVVTIGDGGGAIRMEPVDGHIGFRHWARIHHESGSGHVYITAQYGLHHINRTRIFPQGRVEHVGRDNKFEITDLQFYNESRFDEENPHLVRFVMTGRVRHRRRGRALLRSNQVQSIEEDLKQNVRFVQFENTVFIGNADKSR
jgi:prepilin-type N-terminal cleavage/methylation domain-containing protein